MRLSPALYLVETKKEDRLRKVIAEIEGLFREVQKTLT